MISLTLTPEDHAAVQLLRRDPTLVPVERDRVEMVLLSSAGWSPPRIAAHLDCHAKTVRLVLDRFRARGPSSIRRQRPGPAPDRARRERVTAALDALLVQDRTWTSAQLAAALSEAGISLSARQTRKYLKAMGARWRRTVRTLAHKQAPSKVARATTVLTSLKKRPPRANSASSISTSAASARASR